MSTPGSPAPRALAPWWARGMIAAACGIASATVVSLAPSTAHGYPNIFAFLAAIAVGCFGIGAALELGRPRFRLAAAAGIGAALAVPLVGLGIVGGIARSSGILLLACASAPALAGALHAVRIVPRDGPPRMPAAVLAAFLAALFSGVLLLFSGVVLQALLASSVAALVPEMSPGVAPVAIWAAIELAARIVRRPVKSQSPPPPPPPPTA